MTSPRAGGGLPAADYYDVERRLSAPERARLADLREFLAADVAPHAVGWWERAEFPHGLLPRLAELELSTPHRHGHSRLFTGLVIAEITRGHLACDLLHGPPRPLRRGALRVRHTGPARAVPRGRDLAAHHGGLRAHRARARLGRRARARDHGPARGR